MRLRYSEEDIDAIRAIAGRRWDPERRLWLIPDTPEARSALRQSFGPRLALTEASKAPPARAPSASPHKPGSNVGRGSAPPTPAHIRASPLTPAEAIEALSLAVRTRDYSPKTERAYVGWVRRFIDFLGPEAGAADLDPALGAAFLEHLATEAHLSAKTRNQAASALTFLFREVLHQAGFENVPRAKGSQRLPSVLSHREVLVVLRELRGTHRLIASLLYAGGLRIEECLRLRVKDIDFELRQILVHDGKGKKDRFVPLAYRVVDGLRARAKQRSEQHDEDRRRGHGWAPLPGALDRKDPGAGYELAWQFVFPSRTLHVDASTGRRGRHALHPSAVQREVKQAARRAGINKRVTCHTFRHSFATEALRGGCDIRTLQHVLGHKDVRTTMIYLHAVEQTGLYIRSPLDRPPDPEDPDWDTDLTNTPPRPSPRN